MKHNGAVSIDIQLKAIDINQCERTENYESTDRTDSSDAKLVEFLGTHRCKPTTKCVHVPHQGFKRGSYFCKCKKGYYFPKHQAKTKHFIGESAEAAYDAMLDGRSNEYQEGFDCLQCSPGCSECVDGTPCTFRSNYSIRISLACINGVVMMMAVVFGFAVCMYYKHKVIKASSPRFLIISVIGVVISYMAPFVMMSGTNRIQCIIDQWLQHMGFFIAYSAIIIKTWRVAVIFRVRSAQRIALTDAVLMRRLVLIVMGYVIYMFLWNNVSPSTVTSAKTGDGLIFKRCTLTVWSEILAILGNFGLLAWGMYVCYQVRNAPSAYNESKYVCWSIYNAMFVCCFATVLRFTIGDNTNPDIMFLLEFTFIHTTVTVMLILVVTHKFIHIRKNTVTANVAGSVSNASAHNNQANDRVYVTMDDKQVVAVEHEQLRGEIERLMNKVAVLQSQLMEERNKHVKNGKTAVSVVRRPSALMRLGFSFGVCSIAEKTAMNEEKDETSTQQLETS